MQAILLCGGLSTRLGNITKKTPKILLPIGNRLIIDYQINLLKTANVTEIVLASGHLHEVIFKHIGYQYKGLRVSYAKEDKRLGTGGAIKNAMNYITSEPFFTLNGDILAEGVNLYEMLNYHDEIEHNINGKIDGLILSSFVEDIREFGEIVSGQNGRVLNFKEKQQKMKSGYINGGIYLFKQTIRNYFPEQDVFSVEYDVFPSVSQLYAFQSQAELIDVGVPERLEYARQKFFLC